MGCVGSAARDRRYIPAACASPREPRISRHSRVGDAPATSRERAGNEIDAALFAMAWMVLCRSRMKLRWLLALLIASFAAPLGCAVDEGQERPDIVGEYGLALLNGRLDSSDFRTRWPKDIDVTWPEGLRLEIVSVFDEEVPCRTPGETCARTHLEVNIEGKSPSPPVEVEFDDTGADIQIPLDDCDLSTASCQLLSLVDPEDCAEWYAVDSTLTVRVEDGAVRGAAEASTSCFEADATYHATFDAEVLGSRAADQDP